MADGYCFIPFLPDIATPPDVVLFSYIRGLFVYCPFLLDLFRSFWDLLLVGDVPDVVRILRHGPVGGEDAAAGDVVQAHAVPLFLVRVGLRHALFRLAVRLEIRQQQILIGRDSKSISS